MKVGIIALVVGWLVWLALAIVLGERIGSDGVDYHSVPCAIPGGGSQYGEASWSWWPPGETCRDDQGRVFQAPASWRSDVTVLLAIGIVVLPAATVLLARRDHEDTDEPSVGLDELVV